MRVAARILFVSILLTAGAVSVSGPAVAEAPATAPLDDLPLAPITGEASRAPAPPPPPARPPAYRTDLPAEEVSGEVTEPLAFENRPEPPDDPADAPQGEAQEGDPAEAAPDEEPGDDAAGDDAPEGGTDNTAR